MNKLEELELVSGRDTRLHSHEFDRTPTNDTVQGFASVEHVAELTTTYLAKYNDDVLALDSTAAPFTVTLPTPRNGKRYVVVRIAGANSVTVATVSGNIDGAATATISADFTPLRLKAIGKNYVSV
jgi:hypothetical protein